MQNDSLMDITGDFYNTGRFVNSSLASINLNVDFLNNDSANHYASFTNNGYFGIGGNWLNNDTVKGSGLFCIGQSTQNNGQMLGTFDFCDQTNLLGNHIDYNTGFIAATITYCNYACGVGIAETTNVGDDFMMYPNPANDVVNISLGSLAKTAKSIVIADILGNVIYENTTNRNDDIALDIEDLDAGVYFYYIKSCQAIIKSGKFIVKK